MPVMIGIKQPHVLLVTVGTAQHRLLIFRQQHINGIEVIIITYFISSGRRGKSVLSLAVQLRLIFYLKHLPKRWVKTRLPEFYILVFTLS